MSGLAWVASAKVRVVKITFTLQPEKITYINFCFRNSFPEELHFSHKKIFSGINFPKITYHVFVSDIQRITWKHVLGNIFLENLISVT